MDNPTLLTVFSLVFILLGAYNLYSAAKKARLMKLAGEKFKWTKQLNALVGIEYLLLAWVFLLSNLYRNTTLPSSVKMIVLPFYFLALIAAAGFAGMVIFRGLRNTRALRAQRFQATTSVNNGVLNGRTVESVNGSARAGNIERKRERRKNAAAARRRRAGKA